MKDREQQYLDICKSFNTFYTTYPRKPELYRNALDLLLDALEIKRSNKMRKQDHEIHGYDLYNAFKREPLKDDSYIVWVCVIGAICAFIAFVGADRFIQTLIKEIISSRDTYWKERVRKEVEKLNLRVNQITDGTGVTPVQRGGTSHGHYQAHGEVMGLKKGVRALDTLLDNLK